MSTQDVKDKFLDLFQELLPVYDSARPVLGLEQIPLPVRFAMEEAVVRVATEYAAGKMERLLKSEEVVEALSDVQHDIWSHWMQHQFSRFHESPCADGAPGFWFSVHPDDAGRWKRQMETPYEDLTEKEKDSDRDQAEKVLKVLRKRLL